MKTPPPKENTIPCFQCEEGVLHTVWEDYPTRMPEIGEVIVPHVPVERCDQEQCDCCVLGAEAGEIIDAYLDEVAEAITPKEIQALLEKYEVNQKEAAEITGYGEKTFSRWLRGHMRPSRSVSINLRTLLASREAFEIARERKWGAKTEETVVKIEDRNLMKKRKRLSHA